MTTPAHPHSQGDSSVRAGTVTLVLGVLFAAAVAFTFVLSLSDAVNPPNWVRAMGLVWLPIGLVGTPAAYAVARTGQGRHQARIGVLIAVVGLAAFVALVVAIG
ncbi:hypothetical protein [Nocardioides sp.]|uniref:hypothetical protein n=1 Tax=Nocardioides sp. TaxID=35761 RepID=UPI002D7F6787|nr:hypothetical protein [Nocardioides sp.]HET8960168.1 hypothetical protein [Nocardioides sp.]